MAVLSGPHRCEEGARDELRDRQARARSTAITAQPGRHRHRRDHRAELGVLRLLRLRHRLGAGLPAGDVPLRRAARRRCSGRSRSSRSPSSRGRSGRSSSWRSTGAGARGVKLTLALFLLGCSTAGIAFMPDYSVAGVYAIVILAVMRIAQGVALGGTWDGLVLAARDERAGERARLVRDDPAARGAGRALRRQRALRLSGHRALGGGLPRVGLALSVLRRLRDQRGGAVRAAADRGHAGVRGAVRRASSCSRRGCARRSRRRASTS